MSHRRLPPTGDTQLGTARVLDPRSLLSAFINGTDDDMTFAEFSQVDSENAKGVVLALMSSLFIGASFIIKKKGLLAAGQTGLRAGSGGYSYLLQPMWWIGMTTMIGGEFANLAAYAYAPAIVVTPLGASTIVISALLANCFLP